jgi:hypothetical protein
MLGTFVSIVHGQRMDLTFDLTQRPYDYIGDVVGLLGEDGLHAGEANFSVHQSQQAPTTVTAHHQIDFPITDSSFFMTIAGRSSMETRWGIEPLYAALDETRFGCWCWRK